MMQEYRKESPILTIESVSKQFGHNLILRDIGTPTRPFVIYNITRPNMQQGQTIAVVGASGSGKSTLFKLLSGIHSVTSGTISIPDPNKQDQYRSVRAGDLGFVQQTYPLSRNQSVYSMLKDATIQGKIPAADRRGIIDSYLEIWGLKDQRFLAKGQLSGGQRQRVAIIEQLLCSHFFMVFDEPFSGLDVRNIEDVKNSFRKITSSNEINTIIFSTHDIELAVELSDMVFVMGYEKDSQNHRIPGGTIVQSYDLMEMGLAWQEYCSEHQDIVQKIKADIKQS